MTIKTRNPGIYQTLIAQLDKVAWHNRQGSFHTKERYYEAMQWFCKIPFEEIPPAKASEYQRKASDGRSRRQQRGQRRKA